VTLRIRVTGKEWILIHFFFSFFFFSSQVDQLLEL